MTEAEEMAANELAADEMADKEMSADEIAAGEAADKEIHADEILAEDSTDKEMSADEIAAEDAADKEIAADEIVSEDATDKKIAADEIVSEEEANKEIDAHEIAVADATDKEIHADEIVAEEQAIAEIGAEEIADDEVSVAEILAERIVSDEIFAETVLAEEAAVAEVIAKELTAKQIAAQAAAAKAAAAKEITAKAQTLKAQIEAILFLTDKPIRAAAIAKIVNQDVQVVRQAVIDLIGEYEARESGLEIAQDNGYVIQVKDEYAPIIEEFAPNELSHALLRTLSAIAIKQPVMQSEIIRIRGAGAYEHVRDLMERELINKEETGRSPVLTTTKKFQEYFRLTHDAKDLRLLIKKQDKAEATKRAEEKEQGEGSSEPQQLSLLNKANAGGGTSAAASHASDTTEPIEGLDATQDSGQALTEILSGTLTEVKFKDTFADSAEAGEISGQADELATEDITGGRKAKASAKKLAGKSKASNDVTDEDAEGDSDKDDAFGNVSDNKRSYEATGATGSNESLNFAPGSPTSMISSDTTGETI